MDARKIRYPPVGDMTYMVDSAQNGGLCVKNRFRFFMVIVCALVLSLSSSALAAPQVRMALTGDEGSLNPYTYVTGSPGFNMVQLLYDPLYRMDGENIPQPWLAKDVQVTEGGKVWRITLHDNLTWHDGQPLTSADVSFTYGFVITKEGTHSRYTGPSRVIKQVETPDAKTVVFTLTRAVPSFHIRPLADTPILPKHLWEGQKEPKKFVNSIGSGPYKMEEYRPDQFYRLAANKKYFKGAPSVDSLVIPIIKEPTAMFTAVKAGEIDAAARPLSPELVQQFKSAPGLKVVQGPSFAATLLQINNERAPLNQKEFRQALDFAINKQQLVDTILLGLGVAASPGFVHPRSAFADSGLRPRHDVAQAQQLLDGLGLKDTDGDGFREKADGSKLDLSLLVYANNPLRVRAAELIAADLKKVGVRISVKAMDPTTVDEQVWPGFDVSKGRNYDLSMWGWSAPIQVDPTRLRELVHSDTRVGTLNIGAYKNADADRIGDELAKSLDLNDQKRLSAQLQRIIADGVPFITLWFPDDAYVFNPKVYDGWVFAKGQGIVTPISFLGARELAPATPAASATPATPATSAAPEKSATSSAPAASSDSTPERSGSIWLLVIGAAALAGLLMLLRRRAGK